MSKRFLVGVFGTESDILGATQAVREDGYHIVDVYTPYAVHGMDEAMGNRPSKLPWICLGLGLAGAAAKLWYQIWTSATSWPVNVGGKPLRSVPAFVPVTFEIMVLFAALGTVLAFLIVSKLWFGRRPRVRYDRATNDRFVLVLEQTDAAFEVEVVTALLQRFHVLSVDEQVETVSSVIPVREEEPWPA